MQSNIEFSVLKHAIDYAAANSPFYKKIFSENNINTDNITSIEDFQKLPFSDKYDLRDAYPLGLQAVPDEEVVRIHSSSGTTGNPVIIPYTKEDVEDWATMFARCYEFAGITKSDRIQITPGYGLWTAGIGFQAGCEKLGAMAIPIGPGNTEKQIQMLIDLKSTVLCSTSSYALLLAEEIGNRGLKSKIALRRGVIGSERWGERMRQRISDGLDIDLFDIYGLTEVYGPGIAIDCEKHEGMHYWNDFMYFEIIDPKTGEVLPDGEFGELVITTLRKAAAPLIRYRTHDLTRIIPHRCSCGREYPMIDRISGRTDDMIKVKGVNIYPGQIEEVLNCVNGLSSEYQVIIERIDGKDRMTLKVETIQDADRQKVMKEVLQMFKSKIGIRIFCDCVNIGELPRSEKKTRRIFDCRD
ncbi:MAG: phenylacetate--CoA ligase [Bacillota bacterium]|jgi:phenylacetate-CoA ligase|nr:phenylacetate--CoA ligase [Bacillota bacterium]NLV64011.1 phenylacetate--CoA ligase [Clostridiaceae bacterium]